MLKGSNKFLKLRGSIFVIFFDQSERRSAQKTLSSFLVVCKILILFVNILTPDDKYSLSVKASV